MSNYVKKMPNIYKGFSLHNKEKKPIWADSQSPLPSSLMKTTTSQWL